MSLTPAFFFPQLDEELLKLPRKEGKLNSQMTLWLCILRILVMVEISSQLPQMEVAYELVLHPPNPWIYLIPIL